MRFGVLGPLQVVTGDCDQPAAISAPRLRGLLAVLLWRANQPVPADELAELVWDGAPPGGVREAVRALVLRLRRELGERPAARIVTRAPGYAIEVSAGELDASQFETLTRQAGAAVRAGQWEQAAQATAEALGLWRGTPLLDVPSQLLRDQWMPHLDQLHLQTLEWHVEVDLRGGRHVQLVPELQDLTTRHPFREHFHGQLMLALYRSGRQAEALAAYQRARDVLVTDLGVEPGPGLRDLHQRMLSADPALAVTGPTRPKQGEPRQRHTPRELPSTVPHFTGRSAELQELTRLLDRPGAQAPGAVVISAIGGTAGVGKTALALHWAHRQADRFPDGQLFVNLRGYDPAGTPLEAGAVVRRFLEALAVPPERIPSDLDAQVGLYRSLLAGKRMLIVLDNARDEQQMRPLLPASPGSLVLVTSRSQLGGLAAAEGARLISLDVLTHREAMQLLAARLGTARTTAEPAAVDQIASLCAHLPLALAVAAARAVARPGFPLAALVGELADTAGRLDALDVGDPGSSVRAVFSWSYQQLSDETARMFRLLGIHPGPDITVSAAASLAALAETAARRLLQGLARAHLIAEHVPGRYAFHDLLRAYAAEQSGRHLSGDQRDQATGRVLDHYLHTASRAGLLLNPAQEPVALAPPRPGAAAGQPADHRQALAWFEAEHQVLLAAVALAAGSGFDSHAWQLPWAMADFLHARGRWQEWATTQRIALAAATRVGDTAAQALSGRLLANACSKLGDHDQALGHYASSLTLYQRLGNRLGEAKIHYLLGVLAERQGRHADALGHDEQALRLYQAIGDKANQAVALNAVGWDHGLLGDYQQARVFCRQALSLCAEVGHRWLEGGTWDSLGYAEHHLGNLAEAATCYQRALSIAREAGDRFGEAQALIHLGDTYHASGDHTAAETARDQAAAILGQLENPTPNGTD